MSKRVVAFGEVKPWDMSMDEIKKRYRPKDQPWRKTWDTLHVWHCEALLKRQLYEACKLADMKYDVYLEWWRSKVLEELE